MTESTSPITVVGTGYVGTVVAACFASLGRTVRGLEVDKNKLEALRAGRPPFHEPGLAELISAGLSSGRLSFTSDSAEALAGSQVVFLCVGTPPSHEGRADLRWLEAAGRAIGSSITRETVLVTKSTVPIGTASWLAAVVEEALPAHPRDELPFTIVSNPEFLREGSAIPDFLHPERIVLGSDDTPAMRSVEEVYRPILDQSFPGGNPARRPSLIETSLVTAETVKYAANAFLATKVSFINEIANICEMVGSDVGDVSAAMGLDQRISPDFLDAGVGWGGSCFGKDLDELVATARENGYQPELLNATVAVNKRQRELVVRKLRRGLKTLRGRRIGLLGLAFKPGTDDLREAPAVQIAERLLKEGATVAAHDPAVQEVPDLPRLKLTAEPYGVADRADAVVLVTEWPEYLGLDLEKLRSEMRGDLLIDGRNVLDAQAARASGLRYEGMGRAPDTHSLVSLAENRV
jgi:nucleotide sugar dehydrogenase